ncbi:unnamed protein product [Paramecium pentaurelia]|uniref:Uncharacterized protein n=1 Tax=Paramecium pentaurelia TaxID=43138 RepID=A0A8S1VPH2_9CILI|nr:unnamed protein product [Paramecium pentaurelia]
MFSSSYITGDFFEQNGFYQNGRKAGIWNEVVYKYFFDEIQLVKTGVYQQDKKVGRWKYQYENVKINGGYYDSKDERQNMKIGKWVDVDDEFQKKKQVIYNGEYKFGKKVGVWDILFRIGQNYSLFFKNEQDDRFKLMQNILLIVHLYHIIRGGGLYNEDNGLKNGRWIDLYERFSFYSQVTYIGQYKNGKKVGRWDTWFILIRINGSAQENKLMQKYFINAIFCVNVSGGGLYDEGGEGIKIGQWIELDERFSSSSQLTHVGQYENGKKIGRWQIWYQNHSTGINSLIGGGKYKKGNECIKIGKWIEPDEFFKWDSQIIHCGKYRNGLKVGRWDIFYNYWDQNQFVKIGGGLYDENGHGLKFGQWTELCKHFFGNCNLQNYRIFKGVYMYNKKIGVWVEMVREKEKMQEGFKIVKEQQYDD